MINQVEFEGYLTRAWEYHEQRYMRLANHRPGEDGKPVSSYVTVQVDPSLDFNPLQVKIGQVLRVTGRIAGRDIVEPLKLVVSKSFEGIELPGELGRLVIKRPTVQILATQVKVQWKARRAAPRPKVNGGQAASAGVILKEPVVIQSGQDLAEVISAAQ